MDTVIVVDDDPTFSGLMRTVLQIEGYQVVLVPCPDDVMPTARQVKPALVLMDVHTGFGDTLSVLQELRADETFHSVPVVMTSGMDHSAECLAAGADTFILKPFRPNELLDLIADLIGRQAADV